MPKASLGFSNSSTSQRNISARHFPQPKFSARVSECCPRTLAPLTWFRQPLLNNIARRRANSKLSGTAMSVRLPRWKAEERGAAAVTGFLYPGSTVLPAVFKELIGLTMLNLDDRFATMSLLFPSVGSHKESNDFLRSFWSMATGTVSILRYGHRVIFPC